MAIHEPHVAANDAMQDRAAQIEALLRAEPPPMIQKAIEAVRRDLPGFLAAYRGKWVAYRGDERIGFGRTKTELYEQCLRRGFSRDEFIVCGVEEGLFDPDEEIEASQDV